MVAKGYWIPHLDVSNPEGFQAYRTMADAWHEHNGSRLLARAGRWEAVEGRSRSRNVLREFDDYASALAGYHSPEYQRAKPLRLPHSACDFLIVEGYDGPQPPPLPNPPPHSASKTRVDALMPGEGREGTGPAARKGYWIAHGDVTDPKGYKAYVAANAAPIARFGARFLVRAGRCEVVEGAGRSRTIVLEFPSYQAALDCYRSAEYQAAAALRRGKAEFDLIIIEGYDGPTA